VAQFQLNKQATVMTRLTELLRIKVVVKLQELGEVRGVIEQNYSWQAMKMAIAASGVLLFALCLLVTNHVALANTTITVYFIPFEVETYIAVTPTTIASQAWEKWTISSKRDNDRLLAILNHGRENTFDQNRVRALVIIGPKRYVVDSTGTVQKSGTEGLAIDKRAFVRLGDQLSPGQRQVLRREK